jgi:hypothetical protein
MAALAEPLTMSETEHTFHADAYVLEANLEQPISDEIKKQAYVKLHEDGHYQFEPAEPFRRKGIISYQSGYTQVAGHPSAKVQHGFTTLATSVVEGLNVLDVVTADRVVGQISTTHPPFDPANGLNDMVPSVTFLGTRFDNLRINGHKVEVERHLDILGPKPANEKSYLDDFANDDDDVLKRLAEQYDNIQRVVGLPAWARESYKFDRATTQQQGKAECSLVSHVKGAPDVSFGHVIDLPHFGKIFLGELTVERERGKPVPLKGGAPEPDRYIFHLTMIRLEMGCLAQGKAKIVALDANGSGKGGSPRPVPPPPPPPPLPRR